jgi:predicted secreted protein
MEGKKLLPAIVAILVIVASISLSTTAVADHAPEVTISPARVKYDTPLVMTLTVKNTLGDAIDNVDIIVPAPWAPLEPIIKLPKDNVVELKVDNEVLLPAGTLVTLQAPLGVGILENTKVIRKEGTWIWAENIGKAKLLENAEVLVAVAVTKVFKENGDNLRLAEDQLENLDDNRVALYEDTSVVITCPVTKQARLVEDTKVVVLATTSVIKKAWDNLELAEDQIDNLRDNKVKLATKVKVALGGVIEQDWIAGTPVELVDDNEVLLPAGTPVSLQHHVKVHIPENTVVTRAAQTEVYYDNNPVENVPKGWVWGSSWTTDDEAYMIGATESEVFQFATTSPAAGGDYQFIIRTEDKEGGVEFTAVSVFVDNVAPTYTIAISKDPAKHENVVITVTASEPLSKLENVLVTENNAPENVEVQMTTTDNIIWTGTYETSDNSERDGVATVYVVGVADLVGITAPDNLKTFTIDRLPPPILSAAYGLTALPAVTNQASQLISGYVADNIRGVIKENLPGLTVEVRVGTATTVTTVTSGIDGKFITPITLVEGPNEVGVKVIDKAGNEGPENVQEVFLDTLAPVISFTEISGKSAVSGMLINDNTPTIELTITDPGYPATGLGVENKPFGSSGFSVQLLQDNNGKPGAVIDNLKNALAWDKATGKFENTWPTALAENTYWVFVIAGDNLNVDNAQLSFIIDVTPPLAPDVPTLENPLAGTTLANPRVLRTVGIVVSGTAEAGATVKVYVNDEVVATETAGADGRWTATVSLTPGIVNKVEVTATDAAGNESDKLLLGFATTDTTDPTVSIDALPATTDKASITVSGSASDDITADEDLVVEIDAPGLAAPKRVRVEAGRWTTTVPLLEGANTITVTAVDEAGNSATVSASVERTVPAWGVYAIILVIIALILAAIAIFRKR